MRSKILFLGIQTCLFFHGTQDGSHFGSRFGVYNGFFLAMRADCFNSFVRLTTLILLPECLLRDLWFMFRGESSAGRAAYISSRSWQMPCVSMRPSQHFTSTATLRLAMRESRPGGCSAGSLEDHSKSSRSNGSISIISVVPQFLGVMSLEPLSK